MAVGTVWAGTKVARGWQEEEEEEEVGNAMEEGGRRRGSRVAEKEAGRKSWRRRRGRTVGLFGSLKMQRNLSLSGGGERAVTVRRAV